MIKTHFYNTIHDKDSSLQYFTVQKEIVEAEERTILLYMNLKSLRGIFLGIDWSWLVKLRIHFV